MGREILISISLVLTKVVVYAGIAILAVEGLPITFALLGWGVKPW